MKTPSIKATIRVELRPWRAPAFASRLNGTENSEGIPVAELDDDTLEDMALAWISELYSNAGRRFVPFYKPARAEPGK